MLGKKRSHESSVGVAGRRCHELTHLRLLVSGGKEIWGNEQAGDGSVRSGEEM